MLTIDEQIEEIEEVLRKTPHHKATNHFIGAMRAKIARLKDKQIDNITHIRGGGGQKVSFAVKKQGDATVVLIGPPSAGKSTLINQLTNAESKVAPYAFTTVTVVPGMLKYNEAYIQILDIPGLIEGASKGKGRGKEVLTVARSADLLLIITDVERIKLFENIVEELRGVGIRINEQRPNVHIENRPDGGIVVYSNHKQELDKETIADIAREFGIKNAIITLKEKLSTERIFDAFSSNRAFLPAIFVVNKIDTKPNLKINQNYIPISASSGIGMNILINKIWEALNFVTVFVKDGPMIMKTGDTILDVAEKIGSNFSENKKFAKIWGTTAKFPGQEVSLSTKVANGMKIEFV